MIFALGGDETLQPAGYRPTFLDHLVEKGLFDMEQVLGSTPASLDADTPPAAPEAAAREA